ncbi:MAG: hypothetical protein A3G60_00295 [Candidatus Ryanbacteria bacterium RIFCSPLOWO2_12_FULL_47_9c]|uniref:TraC-like domain-containing protein n=2 Tax=Candidatus Ryaniibacteriota TaxID=1817914 RepID=A0A1G2H2E4_9BACT|nr:MAG: hypothetical protein UX74_C0002G0018 [Parcubacteria group bacterium GW2011_GWA2_47_10b]KKU86141.1 MAG: hypothetical protein UY14_C0006G0018 [Parcubacteria group bacterium GW2011_GWA1_47_9]OGZ45076.1 MAG: hypothetical protein A2844_02030 [Candidatus Ryanbacteria bacterium RIFCSPHIGHO2_01_FULL_48_80]OGZ50556.1 MAG: hypothetical protein A3C83_02570 [Candidatus Ryanbacteria bacterium RIFCSPHIGHO2_02_FULL_47_25]OGZ52263.1 MAG: hypothetical protein A3A29_00160 [Candidatus Ryanbacteria bacteri
MAFSKTQSSANVRASQELVPIEEIRDGVVILKDGSLRAVLMASSLNFALKSPDEQDAIIMQYQNFLNSLDFSIQFFIQSRKLNIDPYLDTLRERKKAETNELLRIQITEYISFVKDFVESGSIVSKSFYIVVPFIPSNLASIQKGIGGVLGSLFGKRGGQNEAFMDDEKFSEYRTQLWQRLDTVIGGLIRTGVRAVPLTTEELIELYYGLYRPEESEKGKAPKIEGKE